MYFQLQLSRYKVNKECEVDKTTCTVLEMIGELNIVMDSLVCYDYRAGTKANVHPPQMCTGLYYMQVT